MPANIIWGAVLLLTLGLTFVYPLGALLCFVLLLPFPTAGLFRLGALIQRGEPTHLSDALAWRSFARRALGAGLVIGGGTIVLGFNVLLGLNSLDAIAWAFATAAFWGLIIVWLAAAAIWPLLLDPLRASEPATALVRLGMTVILARPLPFLALSAALVIVLVLSTILFAALVTISLAYVALVLSAYVIPAADRIEGRRTFVVTA